MSLREMWRDFRRSVESVTREQGYGQFHWDIAEDSLPDVAYDMWERHENGWRTVRYPAGPFISNGLTYIDQNRAQRFRMDGRTVIDTPVRAQRGSIRFSARNTSNRSILEGLGLGDLVPRNFSTRVIRASINDRMIGYTVEPRRLEALASPDVMRCCSCRLIADHNCCVRANAYPRSSGERCPLDGLPRDGSDPSARRCECPGHEVEADSTETGRCEHNWAAVRVNGYSTLAPSGFRSLSEADQSILWSSNPSSSVPYYLGVEWEASGDQDTFGAAILGAVHGTPWVTPQGSLPVIIKTDGSVDYGYEMCFSPMTPGAAMAFPWDAIAEGLGNSEEPSGHGVHIHVSTSAFAGEMEFRRWTDLVNIDLRQLATSVARRTSNEWGRFNRERTVRSDGSAATYGTSQNGRYSAINSHTHHGTHEVRIFRSASQGEEMRSAIAFVTATVEFIRSAPVEYSAAAFRAWVEESATSPVREALMPHFPEVATESAPVAAAGSVEPAPVTALREALAGAGQNAREFSWCSSCRAWETSAGAPALVGHIDVPTGAIGSTIRVAGDAWTVTHEDGSTATGVLTRRASTRSVF